MTLEQLVATERRLLSPLCQYTRTEDYTVYRSEKFPGFYGANGIEIIRSGGRSLSDWEKIFGQEFDAAVYRHKTFTFMKDKALLALEREAEARNYNVVQSLSWMYTRTVPAGGTLPEGLVYGTVETEEDRERYRAFYHAASAGNDWYTPAGCDSLFRKTMYVSEAIDITWLTVAAGDTGELRAVIGVFLHDGIARLQDVETHPDYRRRGLASALLRHVMRYAFDTLGARAVALCADSDYYAIDLYRKAGFTAVGETVELMQYPSGDNRQ